MPAVFAPPGHAVGPGKVAGAGSLAAERGEGDASNAKLTERIQQSALHPSVDERIARLMDEKRDAFRIEDFVGAPSQFGRVRGDADVERLALAMRVGEGAHRFLQRRRWVDPVGIEDVDIVEAHSAKALIEAG